MVRWIRAFVPLAFAAWAGSAAAEDAAPVDWQGFYAGLHGGGGLGLVDIADPYGGSIFGGTARTPGVLLGGQLGYNWQVGTAVLGVEADLGWADMDGTNTCFAYSGFFTSSNCASHIDAIGTLAGRLGWTLPSDGSTLIYGKAGLAAAHLQVDATPGGGSGLPGTGTQDWRWGWMLGAGVERALSTRWSLTAEYNFLRFGDSGFNAPASRFQSVPGPDPSTMVAVPATPTSVSQDTHLFKLGLNYRFGEGMSESDLPPPPPSPAAEARLEVGARYVHGWSQFHKDLGIANRGVASPASRLTYDGPGVDGVEGFARLDTSFGLMVKGLVGGGSSGGQLNDEDWGIPFDVFVPYSNTVSSVDNQINYWTADIGYDLWRDGNATISPFIGYSELRQDMTGFGCVQIANPHSDCVGTVAPGERVIAEDDTWRALRLGIAVDVALAPGLRLSADAAYLPHVTFSGTDDHVLRSLLSPEDGEGVGVQLEAMLSYALTDAWNLGVGGRYWAMWTTSGTVNFGGREIIPMRYAVEQAQLLVQLSYKFGGAPN